jgi:hypothetical protein
VSDVQGTHFPSRPEAVFRLLITDNFTWSGNFGGQKRAVRSNVTVARKIASPFQATSGFPRCKRERESVHWALPPRAGGAQDRAR